MQQLAEILALELHLERGFRVNDSPENRGLSDWAVTEVDDQGRVVVSDQIPWKWTLLFRATSCVLATFELSIDQRVVFEREGGSGI